MKTVIDAVNELEGDWTFNIINNNEYRSRFVWECTDNATGYRVGQVVIGLDSYCTAHYRFICTREEFITSLAECETNFGRWSQIAIQAWKDGDKQLLTKDLDVDIDWSKAPEGATHHVKDLLDNSMTEFVKYNNTGDYGEGYYSMIDSTHWSTGVKNDNNFSLTPKPQPTPIFTQEMYDNGVLPSVGMECEFITTFFTHEPSNTGTGVPIAYHNNKVWFSTGSKEFVISLNVITFKPLTPPKKDKEKLIEEFQNALHDAFGTHTADDWSSIEDIVSDLFDSFLIQPLTVEVK